MNMFRLDGEVALITGGGSGLGYAMAKRCVEAGAQVVICGRRKELLAHSCEEIGPACQYEVFDVTKTESVSHLVQSVRSRLGDSDDPDKQRGDQHEKARAGIQR